MTEHEANQHMVVQVYMGHLRLEEAWQMVRHYFPGVVVTAGQVSIDLSPTVSRNLQCTTALTPARLFDVYLFPDLSV